MVFKACVLYAVAFNILRITQVELLGYNYVISGNAEKVEIRGLRCEARDCDKVLTDPMLDVEAACCAQQNVHNMIN